MFRKQFSAAGGYWSTLFLRFPSSAAAVAATVARPEARHADQPLDLSLLHCGDEHPRRFGEESRRLEDDFGLDRNVERLDDDIDSSQRAGGISRVA